jgi:hypothetical protein
MSGRVAPDEFDPAAGTIQVFRQQPYERIIGRGVNRRRGNSDAQLIPDGFCDFVCRGSRLKLD